jgi:hypothetical protein
MCAVLKVIAVSEYFLYSSVCFGLTLLVGFRLSSFLGLCTESYREFNFGTYRSYTSTASCFYETRIFYQFFPNTT